MCARSVCWSDNVCVKYGVVHACAEFECMSVCVKYGVVRAFGVFWCMSVSAFKYGVILSFLFVPFAKE